MSQNWVPRPLLKVGGVGWGGGWRSERNKKRGEGEMKGRRFSRRCASPAPDTSKKHKTRASPTSRNTATGGRMMAKIILTMVARTATIVEAGL